MLRGQVAEINYRFDFRVHRTDDLRDRGDSQAPRDAYLRLVGNLERHGWRHSTDGIAGYVGRVTCWFRVSAPYAHTAMLYLIIVFGLLSFQGLSLGKMRLVIQAGAILGMVIAIAGLRFFSLRARGRL